MSLLKSDDEVQAEAQLLSNTSAPYLRLLVELDDLPGQHVADPRVKPDQVPPGELRCHGDRAQLTRRSVLLAIWNKYDLYLR